MAEAGYARAWLVKASVIDVWDVNDDSRNHVFVGEYLVIAPDLSGAQEAATTYINQNPADMRLEELIDVHLLSNIEAVVSASGQAVTLGDDRG